MGCGRRPSEIGWQEVRSDSAISSLLLSCWSNVAIYEGHARDAVTEINIVLVAAFQECFLEQRERSVRVGIDGHIDKVAVLWILLNQLSKPGMVADPIGHNKAARRPRCKHNINWVA